MKTIVSINIMVDCEIVLSEQGVFLKTLHDPAIQAMTIHDEPLPNELRASTDRMIHALVLREVGKKVTLPEGTELQWVNRSNESDGSAN